MTKLSKVEDRNGNNLTFTYDEDGFLIETTDTI
ncbi:MAG: hypothetical protein LBF15_04600 [Candidatus Peribacteria bacterium]|jgi:YD repeat-containing protein|nr:hypothetical protein [Candidatus Peribacteria bacterium]